MSEDDANANQMPIILTLVAVLALVLLVVLVRWGNSIGYHPPGGTSKYNPGIGSFSDPPKPAASRPSPGS